MRFAREAKVGRTPLSAKDARTAYAVQPHQVGRPYKDYWDVDRAIREALQKVIPVFRSVHAIADNQARLPVEVRSGSEDGQAVEDHPLVEKLNQSPNNDESAYSFRYRLSSQLLLSRKGAFIEVVPDRAGGIAALYLLDPRKTWPVPGGARDRLISHFEVEVGPGRSDKLDPRTVAWIRLPHPVNPLAGITPLEAAGITVDIDVIARLYNRTFLKNDGRPGGIVGVKGDMDDDVADELEDRFNPGAGGAGRVTIIEADDLHWVDTAISPRDAQYIQALKMTKEDVLGAFGVGESVAYANASGRTYDNVDAEIAIFWMSTMFGHNSLIGDGLNGIDQDPTTFVVFNYDSVPAVQKAKAAKREEMRAEVKAGVRTLDSYLEETGATTVGSPEARSYYRPSTDVPFATEGQDAPILALVQQTAEAAAKAAVDEVLTKGVVTPFRDAPRRGSA